MHGRWRQCLVAGAWMEAWVRCARAHRLMVPRVQALTVILLVLYRTFSPFLYGALDLIRLPPPIVLAEQQEKKKGSGVCDAGVANYDHVSQRCPPFGLIMCTRVAGPGGEASEAKCFTRGANAAELVLASNVHACGWGLTSSYRWTGQQGTGCMGQRTRLGGCRRKKRWGARRLSKPGPESANRRGMSTEIKCWAEIKNCQEFTELCLPISDCRRKFAIARF